MSFISEYHPDAVGGLPLRPTRVELDAAALRFNLKLMAERCEMPSSKLMPVVKANGYGHSLVAVARSFIEAGAGMLAVGFVEEGILLRREGLVCPILVLGGLVAEQIPVFIEYDLQMTVSSLFKAQQVQRSLVRSGSGLKADVHLKIDCDMERIGVHAGGADAFLDAASQCDRLRIKGVYSHFANADSGKGEEIAVALGKFLQLKKESSRHLPEDCLWHMANSAAALRCPESRLDLIRPGIQLYGIDPAGSLETPLLPEARQALSWKSEVVYFKVVEAGRGISYGHRHTTRTQTRIITIPVGYGDGYPRSMSGKAEVLVRGRRYPVVGSICMDQMMVDIGPEGTAYNGDEVVLVGKQGQEEIRLEELARWHQTIPYEILTGIAERVPRSLV